MNDETFECFPELGIHHGPPKCGTYRVLTNGDVAIGTPVGALMLDRRRHGVGRFGGDLVGPMVGYPWSKRWSAHVMLRGWTGPRWPKNLDGLDWELTRKEAAALERQRVR